MCRRCQTTIDGTSRVRRATNTASLHLERLPERRDVVGIAHDDHVARGLAPSPALGPQVEHVVQVDIGK